MEESLIQKVTHVLDYGDDQIQVVDRYNVEKYFSITLFERWLKLYLNVKMRDVRSDVPLLVDPGGGYHKGSGIVFLKHLGIRNRNDDRGQPYYLPYRDRSEFIVKAVWGRETKERDVYDFMLSLLGHAYGSYGSNYFAYVWLKNAFFSAVQLCPLETWEQSLGTLVDRATSNTDFVKKSRQAGISMDDLKRGFPTWNALQQKNLFSEEYHIHFRTDVLHDYD